MGLGALLFARDAFQLEWLLGGTTAALTCSLLLGSLRIQKLRKALPVPLTASPNIWAHFKSSWPYALLFLLMMTYHRVDAIMLERMAPNGAVQAGWYAMGYRLFEAANMIGFLFATLLLPYFTRMLSAGEDVRPWPLESVVCSSSEEAALLGLRPFSHRRFSAYSMLRF